MPPLPLRRTWLRKPSGPLPAERRASLSSDTTPAEEAEAEEGVLLPCCCPPSLSPSLSTRGRACEGRRGAGRARDRDGAAAVDDREALAERRDVGEARARRIEVLRRGRRARGREAGPPRGGKKQAQRQLEAAAETLPPPPRLDRLPLAGNTYLRLALSRPVVLFGDARALVAVGG